MRTRALPRAAGRSCALWHKRWPPPPPVPHDSLVTRCGLVWRKALEKGSHGRVKGHDERVGVNSRGGKGGGRADGCGAAEGALALEGNDTGRKGRASVVLRAKGVLARPFLDGGLRRGPLGRAKGRVAGIEGVKAAAKDQGGSGGSGGLNPVRLQAGVGPLDDLDLNGAHRGRLAGEVRLGGNDFGRSALAKAAGVGRTPFDAMDAARGKGGAARRDVERGGRRHCGLFKKSEK